MYTQVLSKMRRISNSNTWGSVYISVRSRKSCSVSTTMSASFKLSSGCLLIGEDNWNEHLLEVDPLGHHALFHQVLIQRFERNPIRLQAIRPGIGAEHSLHLFHVVEQPGQHVADRAAELHLLPAPLLCLTKGFVQAVGNPWLVRVEALSHH